MKNEEYIALQDDNKQKIVEKAFEGAKKDQDEITERAKMTMKPIAVSDHAFTRYYERVGNLTEKEKLRLLVDDNALNRINSHGDGIYKSKTHYIVVRDRCIVTVLDERIIRSKEKEKEYREYLEAELERVSIKEVKLLKAQQKYMERWKKRNQNKS